MSRPDDIVLRAVQARDRQRPMDVLGSLDEAGYSTSELKWSLARLIHDGEIELTSDRILRFVVQESA